MARWTKRAVKEMQGAINSFVLVNRPLGGSAEGFKQAVAGVLTTRRAEIVIAGIRSLRALVAERAEKNRAMVAHVAARPDIYSGTHAAEMTERFTRLAEEEEKALRHADALVARIELEGLPEEVLAFDPFSRAA